MAPLSQAVNVEYLTSTEAAVKIYQGRIDPNWIVGSVPHGGALSSLLELQRTHGNVGYVLALILEACIQHQSLTTHPDPIHVTAHYLQSTSVAKFEIHVRTLKTGRGFSNILADLVQQDHTKVTAHIIFGVLLPSSKDQGPQLTLAPHSPYARRLPLYEHPSAATTTSLSMLTHWGIRDLVKWAWDPVVVAKNASQGVNRTNETTVGGGGLEWGAWFEFSSTEEKITTPALAFLVDVFINSPLLLPQSERAGLGVSWFPTMTLSIEFKFPIPSTPEYSKRTVGLYSCGRFINDPQGRHETSVEVWTAPSNIGEGKVVAGWREKQVCLAISTQMSLVVPGAVNMRQAQKDTARL